MFFSYLFCSRSRRRVSCSCPPHSLLCGRLPLDKYTRSLSSLLNFHRTRPLSPPACALPIVYYVDGYSLDRQLVTGTHFPPHSLLCRRSCSEFSSHTAPCSAIIIPKFTSLLLFVVAIIYLTELPLSPPPMGFAFHDDGSHLQEVQRTECWNENTAFLCSPYLRRPQEVTGL